MTTGELRYLPLVDVEQVTAHDSTANEASIPVAFRIDGEFATAVGITPDFENRFNIALQNSELEQLSELKDAFPSQYHAALLLLADNYSKSFSKAALDAGPIRRGEKRNELAQLFRQYISMIPGARNYYAAIINSNVRNVLPNLSKFYDTYPDVFRDSKTNTAERATSVDEDDFLNLTEEKFQTIYDELANHIQLVDCLGYWKAVLANILVDDQKLWTAAGIARSGAYNRLPSGTPTDVSYYRKKVLTKARIVAFINAASAVVK